MGRQTDRFYEEIRHSQDIVSYVDVVAPNQEPVRLTATDGEVSCDRTAAVRRKAGISCVDPSGELTPRASGEILTPYGTEIRPYRGVYIGGVPEVAPLGVFRLSEAEVLDKGEGSPIIQLQGFDRSRTVARDKFTTPYVIPAGTNILAAIRAIIGRTYPEAEYDAVSSNAVTTAPLLHDAGDDPWGAVVSLGRSIGCEVYFDVLGRVAVIPPPEVDDYPYASFSYIEGNGCTMLDLRRVYSDSPGYNGVVVTGESPGDELPPVRGEAWDDDPSSLTYRKGPYGEVPMFHTDNLVKTTAAAQMVARSLLSAQLGASAQLRITALVNPAYEASEVVEVVRERSGVSGLWAVDAFNVPLRAGDTQSLTLRSRKGRANGFL
ncbi:DUF5047 domain-containing protein [Streptomyces sp. NPDC001774]